MAAAEDGVYKIDELAREFLAQPLFHEVSSRLRTEESLLSDWRTKLEAAKRRLLDLEVQLQDLDSRLDDLARYEDELIQEKQSASQLRGSFDRHLREFLHDSLRNMNEDWETSAQSVDDGFRLGLQTLGNLLTLERIEGHGV